jgi:5-methylcytosine-specific restriction protein B
MGNWAYIPWCAIIDDRLSTGTQDGIYVVYIFSEDMVDCYLTISIGVTRTGESQRASIMSAIQAEFSAPPGFSSGPLSQGALGKSGLARAYESAEIYYKKYVVKDLPPEDVLVPDLVNVVGLLNSIAETGRFQITSLGSSAKHVSVKIGGVSLQISRDDVITAFENTSEDQWSGRPGYDPYWFVSVEGDEKPIKAVFRNLPAVTKELAFTTNQAKAAFEALGFQCRKSDDSVAHRGMCLLGTWKTVEKDAAGIQAMIAERGAWASCWSFPIADSAVSALKEPFYLYVNAGGGRFPYRLTIASYVTSKGNEGIASPWPDITEPEWTGKTRSGPRQNETFKTWFQATALERVEPELQLDDFTPIEPSNSRNLLNQSAFGYAELESVAVKELALEFPTNPLYGVNECAAETGLSTTRLEQWMRRLRSKQHVVLQGPPGTGKTFMAERLAKMLLSGTAGFVETLQFHPTYSYEDFVYGIRPRLHAGALHFESTPGSFVEFCRRARRLEPSVAAVLILDEFNRANLSRVFGELMYLLEYRDKTVRLATSSESFGVPPNVFLIGTMNTADRSIALVDHALRRRFSFIFLGPDYGALTAYLERHRLPHESLVTVLKKANNLIGDRNYELGISFFLRDGAALLASIGDIWQTEIEPYLEEYFFDQPLKVDDLRWDRLRTRELKEWVG